MSLTDEMEEIEDAVTSNFDYEINQAVVENLRAAPGKVFSRHHAWHFQGKVWFDGGLFHEEVWRHHSSYRRHVSAHHRGAARQGER